VVWASATMSSSPCFRRRLRSTICQPQALRCAAARSSPARPSAAVLISLTRRGGGGAIGPAGGGSAAGPGTVPAAGPVTGRPVGPVLFARLFMRPACPASPLAAFAAAPLGAKGRCGGSVRRRRRSGQGDVLLVELLDVDVLEGHHAHGAHEAVRSVDVPH